MSKNLVIVESPAKAKTIEGFLGKDYLVKSSFGHVRDLVKKGLGISLEKNYLPDYEVSDDKRKVVDELRKLCKSAEVVWLATDEDREGEAISWHLAETLNLDPATTKRIVFHEITKDAIQRAIQNPRTIDLNLVNAQQARRILDRLVGFELSPVLWRKVKPSLSAGRVQSVAVRLIVEREREVQNFNSEAYFRVTAAFYTPTREILRAELSVRLAGIDAVTDLLNRMAKAAFHVSDLVVSPAKKTPAPPFTTSTLQQEASRKLGFSVSQTMAVAQRLYESGKITYMRTDSVNLSDFAMDAAGKVISKEFGKDYHQPRQFKTKNKSAQEAHEAIRPTYLENPKIDGDSQEQRLYELIWKRTMASQMADAKLEKTSISIRHNQGEEKFVANGEVIRFDGFLKLYLESTDEDPAQNDEPSSSSLLPSVKIQDALELNESKATEKFTYHPPRYTEASLVKKLEELGIGRPSTYAPTISTIQKRTYVVKEDRDGEKKPFRVVQLNAEGISTKTEHMNFGAERSKLFPTDIGMVVTDFLKSHFDEIMDYNFTAIVEKEFDEIAEGKLQWPKMIDEFYRPFKIHVEQTLETSDRASGERILGTDPVSGKPVAVRIGRFGPLVQIGAADDEQKPKFANLKKNQRIESITLEEALELFKLPRNVGSFEGQDLVVGEGRFGPYVKNGSLFASLEKTDDPMTLTTERAIELVLARRKRDQERLLKVFAEDENLKILKGRWGPFIAYGKLNVRIPKGAEWESLSFDEVKALVDAQEPSSSKKTKAPAKSVKAAPVKTDGKAPAKKSVKAKTAASKKTVSTVKAKK
jgi:DNA topoisomerase-1